MNSFKLATLIFRRLLFYSLFACVGMAFLLYVADGFIRYSRHLQSARQSLERIEADVIAPKGSTVDHLRRLLRLELIHQPVLLPAQLYTTFSSHPPPGFEVTPVFFWGSTGDTPVIASNANLQHILHRDFPISQLGDRQIILGRAAAATLHAKVGDALDLKTEFGDLATAPFQDKFSIVAVTDLGAWDGAILSSYDHIASVLDRVQFTPEQIWKSTILSYIFATGPEDDLRQIREVVEKRTVAVDLRLQNEVPSLMKLSGVDERLDLKVLIFALISSVVSLAAFLAIWLPILTSLGRKLRRSGYGSARLAVCFSILATLILVIAVALAAAAVTLFPILT